MRVLSSKGVHADRKMDAINSQSIRDTMCGRYTASFSYRIVMAPKGQILHRPLTWAIVGKISRTLNWFWLTGAVVRGWHGVQYGTVWRSNLYSSRWHTTILGSFIPSSGKAFVKLDVYFSKGSLQLPLLSRMEATHTHRICWLILHLYCYKSVHYSCCCVRRRCCSLAHHNKS
jgi:hypothetical protein